jgi:hypothetical protein
LEPPKLPEIIDAAVEDDAEAEIRIKSSAALKS